MYPNNLYHYIIIAFCAVASYWRFGVDMRIMASNSCMIDANLYLCKYIEHRPSHCFYQDPFPFLAIARYHITCDTIDYFVQYQIFQTGNEEN